MNRQGGLNLLELLLILGITALLLGVAVPRLEHLLETHRQAAELNRLRSILDYGRQQASLRGETLQLCSSLQGQTCQPGSNPQGNLLLISSQGERIVFFPGLGHPLAFPDHAVLLRPLPRRGTGATLLPCTGFRRQAPKALTLSASGRVRINTAPPNSLLNRCPGQTSGSVNSFQGKYERSQARYWSASITGITLTGLVGLKLSPWPKLVTLTMALVGVAALPIVP